METIMAALRFMKGVKILPAVLTGLNVIIGLGTDFVPSSEQPFEFTIYYTGYGKSFREK